MIWLLLVWTVLFAVALGWGLAVWKGLVRFLGSELRAPSLFQTFWLGYAALLAFLELWTLAFSVNGKAWALIGVVAIGGVRSAFAPTLKRVVRAISCRQRQSVYAILGTFVFVWMVAQAAMEPIRWFDTLLYHLQTVQWANKFPAVPGLANLHGRLGFNSAYLLFAALLDLGPLNARSAHVTGGFLLAVVGSQWLATLAAPGALRSHRLARGYVLLTLPYLVSVSGSPEVASLSTDLPTGLCALVTGLEIVRIHTVRVDSRLLTILAIGSATMVTKLGGLPMPLVGACIAVLAVARHGRHRVRTAVGLALVPTALVLGYVIRSVIQSGWLCYPVPKGRLPFEWAVPRVTTEEIFRWIQSWARVPGQSPADVLDHGFKHWFVPWFSRFSEQPELMLLLASVAAVVLQLAVGRVRLRQLAGDGILWSWMLGFAAVVNWFLGAPDLRFGSAFFWLLFGAAVGPAIVVQRRGRHERVIPLLAISLCYAFTTVPIPLPAAELIWQAPPTAPTVRTTRVTLQREGKRSFRVRRPVSDDECCANTEIPCAPDLGPVRARKIGDLRAGFTAE
jgi:hypothetical protein